MGKGSKKKKAGKSSADAATALLADLQNKMAGLPPVDPDAKPEGEPANESGAGAEAGKKGAKKKGKKGRSKSSSKGSKGSKGKKKKKKGHKDAKSAEVLDTKPKYTQKDIDIFLKKRETRRKNLREKKLVEKMQEMISIVKSNDIRWTTWSLAPLYNFLRTANVEVVTVFLRKVEVKKEEKRLLWAELEDEEKKQKVVPTKQTGSGSNTSINRKSLGDNNPVRTNSTRLSVVASGRVQKSNSKILTKPSINPVRAQNAVNGYNLIVVNDVVANDSPDMFYFVKLKPVAVGWENFYQNVLAGNLPGGYLPSLYSLMAYVITPMFYQPSVVPESIRKDFSAKMTGLNSSLTETHYRLQCQTMLYVPKEATSSPIDIVSKDKDVCSRLEEAMVHWIRQIKEVVNNQTMQDQEDWAGPLDEIAFWKTRNQDLAGLTAQIRSTPVQTVKTIMAIFKSPFVSNFNAVSSEILGASEEAESNVEYLNVLIEPCTILHESRIKDVPGQLEKLLALIRTIWLESPYYNTRERLNNLLRKISNEIIGHCVKEVDVDKVFNGHVESSEVTINECIDCLKFWKSAYFEAERQAHQFSNLTWQLEYDHIFSHVDAFIHRLQDLLEICVCQRLYARRAEGQQDAPTVYSGAKGPEITRVMKKTKEIMAQNLKDTYLACHLILDAKNTGWHEYMTSFKSAVRDIEMMIQNVLFSAFDSVTNVEEGIKMLETFYVYYQRDIINRAYDKLIVKLYKIFEDETNQVRNLFNKNILPRPAEFPQLAGRSVESLAMQRRLVLQLEMLEQATWLPNCGYGDDVREQATVLTRILSEFPETMYQEWLKLLSTKDLSPLLNIHLMARSNVKLGMIEVNFDQFLARHIVEAETWAKMDFEIPDCILPVYYQRMRLAEVRDTVLLVVEDYNSIVSGLSPEERSLFRDRIKLLDRKIYPGLTRLTWSSDVSDAYIRDCRMAANTVRGFISDYKNANVQIEKIALRISKLLMIKGDNKRVFEKNEFNDFQDKHRNKVVVKIATKYKNILITLRSVFKMFQTDGPEVKAQWFKYLRRVDKLVEDSFCINIRRSLEVLKRCLFGDLRGPAPPIFKLNVVLYGVKLGFHPTLPTVEDMILGIYRRICIIIQPFPRVVQLLNDPNAVVNSFGQVIAKDEIALGLQHQLADGMKNCISEIEKYLQTWEPYGDVWELDKDEFMIRYEKQNPSVKAYDMDVERYLKVVDAVQGCESVVTVGFCILHCLHLKATITKHCKVWQDRLMNSLYLQAFTKLETVYKYMDDNVAKFKQEPTTLPDLVNAFNIFRSIQTDISVVQKQFPLMNEQFSVLNKYEFGLTPSIKIKVEDFPDNWHKYLQKLKDIETMLKTAKQKLRKIFWSMAEQFRQRVAQLIYSFENMEPETKGEVVDTATEIERYRQRMDQLKKDEQDLLSSLSIFDIDIAPNQELRNFEKKLIAYSQI